MSQKIGYPDYLNDSKAVDAEYKRYVLYPGDYYRTKFQFYEMWVPRPFFKKKALCSGIKKTFSKGMWGILTRPS